jgi:hypothetical protein
MSRCEAVFAVCRVPPLWRLCTVPCPAPGGSGEALPLRGLAAAWHLWCRAAVDPWYVSTFSWHYDLALILQAPRLFFPSRPTKSRRGGGDGGAATGGDRRRDADGVSIYRAILRGSLSLRSGSERESI